MDQNQLRRFVQSATGHAVVDLSRIAAGYSRATYIATLADDSQIVARLSIPDAPLADTEITLAREADVYRSLAGAGQRVPRLIAEAPDHTCLLIERAPGTSDLTALDDRSRDSVMLDYVGRLGHLHRLDPDRLAGPGLPRPRTNDEHSLNELAVWERICTQRVRRVYPALDCAFAVLRSIEQPVVERTTLCHGDVGPGNFLHDGTSVTALLDWEFAHLGDPMDDLAGWIFRAHDYSGASGDLGEQLRLWSEVTGLAVRSRDLEYYRAVTLIRWVAVSASGLDSGGSQLGKAKFLSLLPPTAVQMATVLGNLLGIDLDAEAAAPPRQGSDQLGVLAIMREELRDILTPAISEAEPRRRAGLFGWYLEHLDAVAGYGPALESAELADLFAVTGVRPRTVPDGQRALAAGLHDGAIELPDAVRYLARFGHRQALLWPVSLPLSRTILTDLGPYDSLLDGARP
jgi:aminoglycoside phosphotransferase (APT) family kinase protein